MKRLYQGILVAGLIALPVGCAVLVLMPLFEGPDAAARSELLHFYSCLKLNQTQVEVASLFASGGYEHIRLPQQNNALWRVFEPGGAARIREFWEVEMVFIEHQLRFASIREKDAGTRPSFAPAPLGDLAEVAHLFPQGAVTMRR